MIALVCKKAFPFPFYPLWHMDFSDNHHRTTGIIFNKNYVSMLSISGVFNQPGFYRGSAWIVPGSARTLPGSTGALHA
jgi:hypothetical protein